MPLSRDTSRTSPTATRRKITYQVESLRRESERRGNDSMSAIFEQVCKVSATLNDFKDRTFPDAIGHLSHQLQQDQKPTVPPRPDHQKEVETLNAKVQSLESENAKFQTQISSLESKLRTKTAQYGKLVSALHQNAHKDGEKTDEDLARSFVDLDYSIHRHLNKFSKVSTAKWSCADCDRLRPDDKKYYLHHFIARKLHESLFGDGKYIFGEDRDNEGYLKRLEMKLHECKVPDSEIIDWRSQTIKVLRQTRKSLTESPSSIRLNDALCQRLNDYLVFQDEREETAFYDGIHQICTRALDIALEMRARKARYVWAQNDEADSFSESDVDIIEQFNMQARNGSPHPVKVLFGPLYKVSVGERVLLKKGKVLNGYWDLIEA